MEGATGIPPGGNQTLRYFVELSNSTSAALFSSTVYHPNDTVEAPQLPSCENLTVFVRAENMFFNGTSASEDFMTVEPGLYICSRGDGWLLDTNTHVVFM